MHQIQDNNPEPLVILYLIIGPLNFLFLSERGCLENGVCKKIDVMTCRYVVGFLFKPMDLRNAMHCWWQWPASTT